jgi:hypothetical protein
MSPDDNTDIDKLVSDREAFNKFVYTPVGKAIRELKKRCEDKELEKKISISLNDKLPSPLVNGPRAVLFRHIATPNYEIRSFIDIAKMAGLRPLILEYTSDIFFSMNKWKYSLAKLAFYKGTDKNKRIQIEYKNIIDFNVSNGKPLSDIKTYWGQSLVDFHHEFFLKHFTKHKDDVFDLSDWLKKNGKCSKEYYKVFLSLFLKNAILFENFVLDGQELMFTKNVILPALMDIIKKTGLKPLIVALEPTTVENDLFWLCHPIEDKDYVKSKQKPKIPNYKIILPVKI